VKSNSKHRWGEKEKRGRSHRGYLLGSLLDELLHEHGRAIRGVEEDDDRRST
jgi:hypothetical protein